MGLAQLRLESWERIEDFLVKQDKRLLGTVRTFKELADDAYQDVCLKALVKVSEASDEAELAELTDKFTSFNYWRTAVRNRAIDLASRRKKEVLAPEWMTEEFGQSGPAPDVSSEILTRETAAAVSSLVATLVARSEERPRRDIRITRDEWTVFVLAAEFAGEHGNQSYVAKELGVSRSTVSERIKRVRDALVLTHYVVEVLSNVALTDEEGVYQTLDLYEAYEKNSPSGKKQFLEAARHVMTRTGKGTRVNADSYAKAFPAPSAVEDLHGEESRWASTIDYPHPNCVTMCAPHNPTTDRTTEFSNVR